MCGIGLRDSQSQHLTEGPVREPKYTEFNADGEINSCITEASRVYAIVGGCVRFLEIVEEQHSTTRQALITREQYSVLALDLFKLSRTRVHHVGAF